jgi:glycosyltransferase involved in cell wall biosynthesis
MKILVIGTRGIPGIQGGVETHCEELFPIILKQHPNDHVQIIRRSAYVTPANDLSKYKGIHIKTLYSPHTKSLEALIHSFLAVLYAAVKRPDVLHIHAIGPSLVTPLARLLGLKVIMTHHGPDYERKKWGKFAKYILKTGEWCGVKFANKVIVISDEIGQQIAEKYGRKDYILIPNGVPVATRNTDTDYLEQLGVESERYIFTLGRFVPEKGFDYLIKAYKKSGFSTLYKLVIAGDADHESEYSSELKKRAQEENVILTGFIKGRNLQQLFTHTRLFILPSFYEGLPISLLEAMSFGCDILASDIEANKEVQLSKSYYFETGNIESLAKNITDKLQRDISVHDYDMSNYNWENIAEKTYMVYSF